MDLPFAPPMAKEIALAMADFDKPVHPGQQTGLLQRGERHAHAVTVTLRDGGNPLVGGEATPAAIGTVEAP